MHACIRSMYIAPFEVAMNCRHALPIRLLGTCRGPLCHRSQEGSRVLEALPAHLAWLEMSDLGSDKAHHDSFSSLAHKRSFIPYLLQRSRWEEGGRKNQYLHTAVSGPRCHRPLGPQPTSLWKLCGPQSPTWSPPGTWSQFTQRATVRLAKSFLKKPCNTQISGRLRPSKN